MFCSYEVPRIYKWKISELPDLDLNFVISSFWTGFYFKQVRSSSHGKSTNLVTAAISSIDDVGLIQRF